MVFPVYNHWYAGPSCPSVPGGKMSLLKVKPAEKEDNSAAKLQKLAEEKRFRQKEAMAQSGGSEAFLRWLQTDGGRKA